MAHLLFDALNGVTLDNQTALTVQSLLDSQGLSGDVSSVSNLNVGPPTTVTLDEEDVFQCGKCKKQFTSFSLFMCHKKEHTTGSPVKLGESGISLSLEGDLQGQGHGSPQVQGHADSNHYHHLQVHTLHGGVTSPELGQPIIIGDTDILSFSIDQGSLNIASSSQAMPSLSSVIQGGAFFATTGDSMSSPKSLAEDETSSASSTFNVATLAGQPIILTSSELAQGSFLTSALPSIQSITSQGKLSSLQTDPSTTNNKDNCRNINIVAAYPNRLMKGCKVLLPNIDYIDRDMEGHRTMLLDCGEDSNKKTEKVLQYEEGSLDNNRTLLFDYSSGDTRKTCKVLLPNVEYTETSIEYIDCAAAGQAGIVEYQSMPESKSGEVAVDVLDVMQPTDAQDVTLNLSKSSGLPGGEPMEAQSITVTPDTLSIAMSGPDMMSCQNIGSGARFEETNDSQQNSYLPKSLKLKCDYCTKMFSKNFDLQQHLRSHTGEKPFQCVVCGRAFSQKSNVKKHMATHKVWPNGLSRTLPKQPLQIIQNGTLKQSDEGSNDQIPKESDTDNEKDTSVIIDRSYVCQYCNAVYPSYFELKTHMKEHSHQKVYKCIQRNCQKTFSDLDGFLEHTAAHSNEVQYCCHVCCKKFTSLADLGIHQYCHTACSSKTGSKHSRYFLCMKCKSKFTSSKALEHHLSTTNHNYPCPHCGKVFACERYLRRHLPTHGAPESFTCPQCGKGFRTEQYLNTHRFIHTGEKPFACQHCPAAFNRKDKLARHSLIHQAVKKFKCPFQKYLGCTKAFNRQDKLKLHILTHSAVKPSQCRKCKKIFHRQSLLREHERSRHCGDGSFSCGHCGTSFRKKFQLTTHICSPTADEQESSQDIKDPLTLTPVRQLVKPQPRSKKHRKMRSHRQVSSADDKIRSTKKADSSAQQPEEGSVESSGAGDNVPTIEIIVMPLDRREQGEQDAQDNGVYHVMFPSNSPTNQKHSRSLLKSDNISFTSKHATGGKTIVTLIENTESEVISDDRSEDQQVPVADDRLLKVMIPSNKA